MKDPARFVISVIFVSPLLALAVTTFHGSAAAVTETSTQSAGDRALSREERVQQRAEKYRGRFTWSQLQRTKQRCEAAQQKLQAVNTRVETLKTARSQAHAKVVERLEGVVTTLEGLGVDTADLPTQVTELKAKTAAYQNSLLLYTIALGDLTEPSCVDESEDFRATLEELRELRKTLVDQGRGIKTYLQEAIRPDLETVLVQVKAHQEDGAL